MWDGLTDAERFQLVRWLDMAEHHAMREHSMATETTTRNAWSGEVRVLARLQSDLRNRRK